MTLKFKHLLPFIFIALSIGCKKKNTQLDKVSAIISNELDVLISKKEIDGASIGIYLRGKTYEFHRGALTNGMNNPPKKETLYEIASLTKTFSGVLLAQAVTEGKVKLDDDVRMYLKGNFPNLEYQGKPITFLHLVTHRSGLPLIFPNKPELFDNPNQEKLPFVISKLQAGFTKNDYFEELLKVKLDTIPGSKFGYSNPGANLLGYCLENIYNMSFEQILKAKILSPLKMDNTRITLTESNKKKLAQGYNDNNIKMPFEPESPMKAAGGILSNVGDMLKYIRFHLHEDNDVIKVSHKELLGLWNDFDNGLFWQILIHKNKPNTIFQNGGAFGTSSWLTLIPEKQIGVFIVTNKKGNKTHKYLNSTVESLIEKLQ